MPFQKQMTLGDVAVDLTQEEWGLVGPAPRTLYQDVMLETFGHLITGLGDPSQTSLPSWNWEWNHE